MMAKLEHSPQQARMEAVSRDALVQAELQEINQNYREASLSNVARAYLSATRCLRQWPSMYLYR